MPEDSGIDASIASQEAGRTTEGRVNQEARDSREAVTTSFQEAFDIFQAYPEDKLTPEQQAARDQLKELKAKTIDQNKSSFLNKFQGEDGTSYKQMEYLRTDQLITFLRQRVKSGELSPEDETKYRKLEKVLHRNSQEYYRGRGKKEYDRKMARIKQEADKISADPRLTTGDLHQDFLKASESLFENRELIIPAETTEPPPTEPPDPPPTDPPPVEDIKREFVIANRTLDIRKRAAELAEEQLRNEMRRGSAWNPLNWPRKIALRVGEDFYRQRFIERATTAMVQNNNSFLEMDVVRDAVTNANARIDEERAAGQAKIDTLKTGEQMEGTQVREAQGALKQNIINEMLRPIIDGTVTTQADLQTRLRQFVENNQNDPDVQAVFGRDATQYGRLAEYFASDLLEMGQRVKEDIETHKYALDQLDNHINIKLANTRWAAETEANFTRVDRAVAWAQRSRLRGVLNPAAIGALSSLATFGLFRAAGSTAGAAQWVVPGVGTLFGAGVAGVRRYHDLKVDRASHQVERAYNRQIPQGASRREAIERYAYNTASVDDLLGRLRGAGQDRQGVMRAVAEIKTRLDFSAREKVDLVTYESREQVEQGRLQLIKAIVEARQNLRNAGVAADEITTLENQFTGEFNQQFIQNREQQDNAFNWYRVRNAVGSAAFGGVAGLASGLLVQEGIAIGGRAMGVGIGRTVIEGALSINPDTGSRFGGLNLTDVANKAGSYEFNDPAGQKMELVAQPFTDPSDVDRKIDFVTPDKKVVPGPAMWVTPDKGNVVMAAGKDYLPPAVKDMFGNYEFKVTSNHNLREYMQNLVNGDIKKTPDEVLSYGNFLLNTHDIKQSNFINPEGLPYDEWAAKVGRINPATGLVEEGKMSITHPASGVQLHGFLRGDGSFDVNKDFFVNDQYPGNKNITPDQFNNVVSNLKTEGWGVEDSATGYHITPPEAFELTAHLEEAPIIPIPFAPRHPLEPLGMPEVPYYPSYPESKFPPGSRLVDILRRGRPSAEQLGRRYQENGEVIIDQAEGRRALQEVRDALNQADGAFVVLGGAIGDAVISTAYLRGLQETFKTLSKDVPLTLIVSDKHGDLFDAWATKNNVRIVKAPRGQGLQEAKNQIASSAATKPILLDLEHYRQENPYVEKEQINGKSVTSINSLLAPAVELYNNSTDQERKFAKYTEDLFSLPRNSLDPNVVRPIIELPQNKDDIYNQMVNRFGIDPNRPQISVVVESQIAEKRYPIEYWIRTLALMSQQNPQLQFNIIYNPQSQAPGFSRDNIEERLRADGILDSSHLVSGSLTEMAVLLERQVLTMSNDTGLAHIATSIENGPNILSLHIPYFPPNFWVANPKKQTALLPPEGETSIAAIPPELVAQKALEILGTPTRPIPRPAGPRPAPASPPETFSSEIFVSPNRIGQHTETDPNHANRNEDSNFVSENMAGVFDGMGGLDQGDVASQTARDIVESELSQIPPNATPEQIEQHLREALRLANERVHQTTPQGGTTGSIVRIWEGPGGERKAIIGNMGDSRIWLYKKDGTIIQLSEDDSVLRDAFQAGRLSQERYTRLLNFFDNFKGKIENYTQELQGYWNNRNVVYRYLGMPNFACDTKIVDVEPDDVIILTSDGIHDNLTTEDVKQTLQQSKDPQEAVESLVKNARHLWTTEGWNPRAKGDDTTALALKIPSAPVAPTSTPGTPSTAQQIQNAFTSLGSAIKEGAREKVTEYTNRILAGQNPAQVLRGLPQGARDEIMKRVRDIRAGSSTPTPTPTPTTFPTAPAEPPLVTETVESTVPIRGIRRGVLSQEVVQRFGNEEREIQARYSGDLPTLSPVGEFVRQTNPYDMNTCWLASADNALRSVLGESYDPNKHGELALVNNLGGESYANANKRGANVNQTLRAIRNNAPELSVRRTNSVNEILQAVERGAAVVLPLTAPRNAGEIGHVGAIQPGQRVRKGADGELEVQVIDPMLNNPKFVPVRSLIRDTGVVSAGDPDFYLGLIIEKPRVRMRSPRPTTPPVPEPAPAEEITEELPVVAPLPPAEPSAPEATTQDMSIPELEAALREANLTASNYAESEADRQTASFRAQELTNEIARKRAEPTPEPVSSTTAAPEPEPEEVLEATQQIPPQPATETPSVKTLAEMSDDEMREELNQGADRYLSGQATEDEMRELERRSIELSDELRSRRRQRATPAEEPPAETAPAPEPPALPPEEIDRRRQTLDAYIERYRQDNPGLSPEEARRQVIERLKNQGRGQNG